MANTIEGMKAGITKYRWGHHPNSRNGFKKGRALEEKNPNWKGEQASYTAFHHWLKYHYGKASECENKECVYPRKVQRRGVSMVIDKPSMYQWALLKGKQHAHKRENYIQLCVSCHEIYDKNN